MKNLLRKFVWYLIEDQVRDAISEFDEELHDALFGVEECGIESSIEVHVNELLRTGSTLKSPERRFVKPHSCMNVPSSWGSFSSTV